MSKKKTRNVRGATDALLRKRLAKAGKRAKADKNQAERKRRIRELYRLAKKLEELKAALREAMGWNWLDEQEPPPREVVERCYRALGESAPITDEVRSHE